MRALGGLFLADNWSCQFTDCDLDIHLNAQLDTHPERAAKAVWVIKGRAMSDVTDPK